ncbi:uncharacterized protein LOC111249929 isoform X1 [Varroa destructor]|uniref:Uncharacterized protein n=1 Tax=Varroa destructor TaxID=109461 RepID=A0A7M7K363_VARDE|nr:uncharacterized protein LOC111249929 isoform X1 [Varroa destructor]XP_022660137.1 uncharacterized protein LOC111249929 isoform X1 [Varroa destructor]
MSLTRKVFNTDKAPEPIGPYSHAIKSGNMVYTSGQVGSHPDTRALVDGGITPETRQALKNLKRILEHAGSSMAEVVKCTIFIADMKEFVDMNRVYAEFFPSDPPARSCVQVARLPMDARVEIEAIAIARDDVRL